VLHVNYKLRGADSDADQQLVEETAVRFGLKAYVHSCDLGSLKRKGANLQAEAREFRRRFFTEWTAGSEDRVVVLAHHADDQLETFFLQLLRGSGTFGLGGMHPERNRIVRPFLHLPKSALLEFAETNGIHWREDASNAQSAYLRNLFRNEWLPALVQETPSLKESVLLLMELFRERQPEVLDSIVHVVEAWQHSGLQISEWSALSGEQKLAFTHAVGIPAWTIARFDQLTAADNGAHVVVGNERIERGGTLLVRRKVDPVMPIWDFKIEEVGILPEKFDKQTVYLDGEKLLGPLHMRLPQTGDRIQSVGVPGSQLVSDVLKDAGIPRSERAGIHVLTDGSAILWIPGIKVGRTAIAHIGSRKILKITAIYVGTGRDLSLR
jgi:tRNA(Ile)-lysidine synthase